ncbi:MAG TPA: hypothetical protein VFP84_14085 [Kofleriaceae bacterium]|nr:hypothetical protein [Kofleriaceae bacterium]
MGLLVGSVACGGDDGGSASPSAKCHDLVSSVCIKLVDCLPGAAGMEQDCIDAASTSASCDAATSVAASYDDCRSAIDQASCSTLVSSDPATGEPLISLPDACLGVIQSVAPGGVRRAASPASSVFANFAAQLRH